jgi:hypothetical protein
MHNKLFMKSLINEHIVVNMEAVDSRVTLFSIAIGDSGITEGKLGVAVAIPNKELKRIRDAITAMLNGNLDFA